MSRIEVTLGGSAFQSADESAEQRAGLTALLESRFASRLFAKDSTLWGEAARPEASIRLGWTEFAPSARRLIPEIEALRAELRTQGVDRVVLCGMGGSSLAPAVICRWAGAPLVMLDSTHPAAVSRAIGDDAELTRTAVVVSSKSGSTIETRSQLAAFESAFERLGIAPSSRIIIVTDPGSALDTDSRAAGRRVFNADPNVGGRFSALTAFGLVPSCLAGADVRTLVEDAQAVRELLAQNDERNPALRLAAAISARLPERYLLATRSAQSADWGLGAWIEQLIAESTGKNGLGVLPVALEADAIEFRRASSNVLTIGLTGENGSAESEAAGTADIVVAAELGAQLLFWEVVTAALGALMGIDPFNQPDVESAKVAARAALVQPGDETAAGADEAATRADATIAWLRNAVPNGGYLVLQAFLDQGAEYSPALTELRERLADALGVPVALCWGPSYLHSTGQLHKGGPALGAFLQFVETEMPMLEIPGSAHGFETLIAAQARGDREVLLGRGRPVLTIQTNDPAETAGSLILALEAR